MIKSVLASFFNTLADLIYPSSIYCICCGGPIHETVPYSICPECMKKIKWAKGRTCVKCGKPLQSWYYPDTCIDCTMNRHFFEKGFTCASYGEIEKKIIYDLKYNEKSYLGSKIAELMADKLKNSMIRPDCILPVPLHKAKLLARGYNQAELIGLNLSKLTYIKYRKDILSRIKNTEPMNKLSFQERKNNLKNAFFVEKPEEIRNKSILLVDDVYTTGSTGDECSKVLLSSGAKRVWILTFAAGENK